MTTAAPASGTAGACCARRPRRPRARRARPGAQFVPYFGKNKVTYDNFAWRVYKSPHFEVYYYPEFEQHLARVVSYAESAYQKVSVGPEARDPASRSRSSSTRPTPSSSRRTSSRTSCPRACWPSRSPCAAAWCCPSTSRRTAAGPHHPRADPRLRVRPHPAQPGAAHGPAVGGRGPGRLQRGIWDSLDLMIGARRRGHGAGPASCRASRSTAGSSEPALVYNLGHAAFEFIEARYGKEGIRQFLYTFRKNIVGGGMEDIYQQAFRIKPEEFDEAFEKWLKERFKPFRDKQRPERLRQGPLPEPGEDVLHPGLRLQPQPLGRDDRRHHRQPRGGRGGHHPALGARTARVIKNLTKGFTDEFENLTINEDFVAGRSIDFDPKGDTVAFFARKGKRRSLLPRSPSSPGKILRRVPHRPRPGPGPVPAAGRAGTRCFAALKEGVARHLLARPGHGRGART